MRILDDARDVPEGILHRSHLDAVADILYAALLGGPERQ